MTEQQYPWTDNPTESGIAVCDTDILNDCLMHLKYEPNKSYSNLNNITNCLLEVPQRIKLELNDGVLTLKAGSQVIVPNGFEADGTTPKFDYVDVESDLNLANGTSTEEVFFIVTITASAILRYTKSAVFSGSVAPTVSTQYACWYDIANNVLKTTSNTGATWEQMNWGLPIGVGTTTSTSVTSIDQVFNGFGYIGSTVWVDKGVKGLIPNGRNADGSLKNIETITNQIYTLTDTVTRTNMKGMLYPHQISNTSQKVIITDDNILYIGDFPHTALVFASFGRNEGVISNFNPKLPFRITDNAVSKYGDTMTEGAMLTFLNQSAHSYIGISALNKYADVTQSKPAVQEDYMYINCFDKNDKMTGEIFTKHMTNGAVCTCVRGYGHSTGKQVMSELQAVVDVNGTAYATAPPSYEKNSIVTTTGIKKATSGYLKLGNGIIFQWGTFKATVEGTSTITFPTPFSNANYAPFCRRHQERDNDYENGFASSRTTTSFKAGTWNGYTYSWYAIGY